MNSKENFIIDKPYSLQPEDEQAISNVQNKGLTVHSWSDKELDSLKQNTAMKNNKSQIRYISSQTHRRESRRVKTQLGFNLASGASVS